MSLMTPYEKAELISLLEKSLQIAKDAPCEQDCLSCINFDAGFCKYVNLIIPAHIQKVGCEVWRFDPNSPPF